MASRIFWIMLVGVALVAGSVVQERDWFFGWAGDAVAETRLDAAIETRVDDALESSFERMQVVGSDGRTIDVAPETKRELGDAVRRLATAEAELAVLRVRGSGDAAASEVRSRREAAMADVERLKAEIDAQETLSQGDRDLMRQHIQQEIRSSVRETIRSAVPG